MTAISRMNAPAREPLSLDEAKMQARISGPDDDSLLLSKIEVAREDAEDYTGSKLITQTWDWTIDCFDGCAIELPIAPVQSIESITYLDTSGAEQTLDPAVYKLDPPSNPARPQRLTLKYGQTWPSTYAEAGAVTIRMVAGYGDEPSDVPAKIREAMLLRITSLYENREPTTVERTSFERNLDSYRVWCFG